MPLLIQNRGLDRITSTMELFDKYPHLQVCFWKVWLNLLVYLVSNSASFVDREAVNDKAK